jgi:Fe-S cluster assembly iron-binding protein IscA
MQLSTVAADKIKEILAQNENPENLKLRVEIEGFG